MGQSPKVLLLQICYFAFCNRIVIKRQSVYNENKAYYLTIIGIFVFGLAILIVFSYIGTILKKENYEKINAVNLFNCISLHGFVFIFEFIFYVYKYRKILLLFVLYNSKPVVCRIKHNKFIVLYKISGERKQPKSKINGSFCDFICIGIFICFDEFNIIGVFVALFIIGEILK